MNSLCFCSEIWACLATEEWKFFLRSCKRLAATAVALTTKTQLKKTTGKKKHAPAVWRLDQKPQSFAGWSISSSEPHLPAESPPQSLTSHKLHNTQLWNITSSTTQQSIRRSMLGPVSSFPFCLKCLFPLGYCDHTYITEPWMAFHQAALITITVANHTHTH